MKRILLYEHPRNVKTSIFDPIISEATWDDMGENPTKYGLGEDDIDDWVNEYLDKCSSPYRESDVAWDNAFDYAYEKTVEFLKNGKVKPKKLASRYCKICGKELPQSATDRYDSKTGKLVYQYDSCEIKDCRHGFHDKVTGWRAMISPYDKCKKCGIVPRKNFPSAWGYGGYYE